MRESPKRRCGTIKSLPSFSTTDTVLSSRRGLNRDGPSANIGTSRKRCRYVWTFQVALHQAQEGGGRCQARQGLYPGDQRDHSGGATGGRRPELQPPSPTGGGQSEVPQYAQGEHRSGDQEGYRRVGRLQLGRGHLRGLRARGGGRSSGSANRSPEPPG